MELFIEKNVKVWRGLNGKFGVTDVTVCTVPICEYDTIEELAKTFRI